MYILIKTENGETKKDIDLNYLFNELGLYQTVFLDELKEHPESAGIIINQSDKLMHDILIEKSEECRARLYCAGCRQETNFVEEKYISNVEIDISDDNYSLQDFFDWYSLIVILMICQQNPDHEFQAIFRRGEFETGITLTKIGQYPSLADIQNNYIRQYKKYVSLTDLKEFNKAVGLHAHGIGIGSFVYLRRIFERQVTAAFEQKKLGGITEDDINAFYKKDVKEKITYLKAELPAIIFEEKGMVYPILSKGIHELEEDECKKYFPILKLFILEVYKDIKRVEDEKRAREDLSRELSVIKSNMTKKQNI